MIRKLRITVAHPEELRPAVGSSQGMTMGITSRALIASSPCAWVVQGSPSNRWRLEREIREKWGKEGGKVV